MKAAFLEDWNFLRVCERETPIPNEREALLRVIYGGICGSDITVYRGQHMTAEKPVILCHEILGRVEKLPQAWEGEIQIGDTVLVNPVMECGKCEACLAGHGNVCRNLRLLGIHENGGFAEYVKVRADRMVKAPKNLPLKIAALGEPFAVGYHVTSRAQVKKGDRVLIVGAGTIGLVTALTMREKGAGEVWVAERNPRRRELAEKLGFGTIDVSSTELLQAAKENTGQVGYDMVIDASGARDVVKILPDLCKIRGRLMSLGLSGACYEFPMGKVSFKEQEVIGSRLYSQEHFIAGVELLSRIYRKYPVECLISEEIPLDQIVCGIERMINGKALGKILVACEREL